MISATITPSILFSLRATIPSNGAGGEAFSAEAQNYFDRLDTAGDTTYVDYKQPLANYIDSLVALGGAYWDTMESAASFVGVGIQGITVPLRDGMPVLTENNFIDLDLDQLTGLKGNSTSGKYLSTNTDTTDYAQNDNSLSFYVTDLDTATSADQSILCGIRSGTGGNPFHFQYRSSAQRIDARNFSGAGAGGVNSADGFFGSARDNSSNFTYRRDSTDLAVAIVSGAQANADLLLFAADNTIGGSVGSYSDARLATYHAGPALDLATLEALQDTLITEVAEAQFSAEAANYFSRLVAAGDTTHYAYRQPLANYIDSLVTLGGAYWDDMKSSASFVGVGIQGVTVPLRSGMPVLTNNNFVVGDLDQLTGLKGDGSTKYLATNVAGTAISQNDASISVYIKESHTAGGGFLLGNSTQSAVLRANATQRLHGSTALGTTPTPGLYGAARSTSTDIDVRSNATDYSAAVTSTAPNAGLIGIFALGTIASSNPRLATYHAGFALDLATLEGLQETLITEIAAI